MGGNMVVSGAMRIKENERIKKQTALSYAHLERNNARLNGWMILKFNPEYLTHTCNVYKNYSWIQRCKWEICASKIDRSAQADCPKMGLDLPSWAWAFLHGFGPSSSWIWAFILGLTAAHFLMGLAKAH